MSCRTLLVMLERPAMWPDCLQVAQLLHERLSKHGFSVAAIDDYNDPEIVAVELAYTRPFNLRVFVLMDPKTGGLLLELSPAKPFIRHWFRKRPTSETMERLAAAVSAVLREAPEIVEMRWLDNPDDAKSVTKSLT